MLAAMGFSLQANAKVIEGRQHEDRDAQFRYLNDEVGEHQRRGSAGDLGRHEEEGTGRRVQERRARVAARRASRSEVNVHDFLDKELGKAIPYGVYDVSSQHRLGERGHRPRHRRVRRGDSAPLVEQHRARAATRTPTGC